MKGLLPITHEWESYILDSGVKTIAGVDEVGRGALAGPLMAGAVILPEPHAIVTEIEFWNEVKDSKVLSFTGRAVLSEGIISRSRAWGIGTVEADELDDIGVAAANRTAMERAVHNLNMEPDYLLIDATTIDLPQPQLGLINGDALSLSIAAASIIAKHTRDTIMIEQAAIYPEYGFEQHKGYGSIAHKQAIAAFGPCPIHRYCYAPVRAAAEEFSNAR